MATLSAPLLNPAMQEDHMELSSPGNRPLDDDIEIDVDGEVDVLIANDEHMGDDVEHSVAVEHDEDMLQFDDDTHKSGITESQGFSTVADEDLIDYSDEEPETTQPEVTPQDATGPPHKEQTHLNDSEEADHQKKESKTEIIHDTTNTLPETSKDGVPVDTATDNSITTVHQTIDAADEEQTHPAVPLDATAAEFVPAQPTETTVPEEGDLKPRLSTTSSVPITEGPGTPTDTGLHPVVMSFLKQKYPLFRTRTSSDGLLKDDNLASISLADLIKACRQSLVIRTQQEIEDSFDLVLEFKHLNVSVVEDSPAAFQVSLQEVLDVYVHLQANDGHEPDKIPPLEITCYLEVRFNDSIRMLKNAAHRGEGLVNLLLDRFRGVPEQIYLNELYYDYEEDSDAEEVPPVGQDENDLPGDKDHASESLAEHHDDEEHHDGEMSANEADHTEIADEDENENETPTIHNDGEIANVMPNVASADSAGNVQAEINLPAEDQLSTHEQTLVEGNDTVSPEGDAVSDETLAAEDVKELEEIDDRQPDIDTGSDGLKEEQAQTDLTISENGNVDGSSVEATHSQVNADLDGEHSDFELDLEDYDHPDATPATSPSMKRQREVEDAAENEASSKKLRST